ncbi:MAG: hypothetical protein R8K21_03280 [Mariprofundales bacterium]
MMSKLLFGANTHDGVVTAWDANDGNVVEQVDFGSVITTLAISSNNRLLAAGNNKGEILLWDLDKRKLHRRFTGSAGRINALYFTNNDNKIISSTDNDALLRVWDIPNNSYSYDLPSPSWSPMRVAMSSDTKLLALASGDTIDIWNLVNIKQSGKLVWPQATITSVIFSGNSNAIAAANDKGDIAIWQWQSKQVLIAYHGHDRAVNNLQFTKGDTMLYSSGKDKIIKAWKLD